MGVLIIKSIIDNTCGTTFYCTQINGDRCSDTAICIHYINSTNKALAMGVAVKFANTSISY